MYNFILVFFCQLFHERYSGSSSSSSCLFFSFPSIIVAVQGLFLTKLSIHIVHLALSVIHIDFCVFTLSRKPCLSLLAPSAKFSAFSSTVRFKNSSYFGFPSRQVVSAVSLIHSKARSTRTFLWECLLVVRVSCRVGGTINKMVYINEGSFCLCCPGR